MFEFMTSLRNFTIRKKAKEKIYQPLCSQVNLELVSKVTSASHHRTVDLPCREELLVILCIAKVPCQKEACHLAPMAEPLRFH